jgi:hypothetical protein
VKWESQKQRLQVIPGGHLYPPSVFQTFRDAFVRFLKLVSLASSLRLTTSEIAYLATNAEDLINDEVWLNSLPTQRLPSPDKGNGLLEPLWGLLDFARIKADWSPDDERVLAVLKDPTTATANPDSLLFTLSSWNKTSLDEVLRHFGKGIPDLAKIRLFRRIYNAFAPIQRIAIPASKLISATTNEPSSNTVRDFQAALRARFDAASWRDVVRPMNDTLRAMQRDALVAYILHQMRENSTTAHIDTADKLFEFFLMDVEMDPCMQTSRIRNALSTVQLFIERCLMNLEPDVSPASIDAAKWTWMKRYRLWEANRKVFLFPENWLEPELRDDKSPFFKGIETQLLQSDITDDSAASAMLDYLAKLDEVATLEPCTMYVDEQSTEDEKHTTDDIIHVVARTPGAHRVYYYRRHERESWTPWEQIKLDIEDNPLQLVVWRKRLFLFWLRIIKQGPQTFPDAKTKPGDTDADKTVANLNLATMNKVIKYSADQTLTVSCGAMLCWSEYVDGKWQAIRTSDVDNPQFFENHFQMAGENAFDRSKVRFERFETLEGLLIIVDYPNPTVLIPKSLYFFLDDPKSVWKGPRGKEQLHEVTHNHLSSRSVWFNTNLWVHHYWHEPFAGDGRWILRSKLERSGAATSHGSLYSDWWSPFLITDFQYAYWVTVNEKAANTKTSLDYGISVRPVEAREVPIHTLSLGPYSEDSAMQGRKESSIRFGVGPADLEQFARITYGSRRIGPRGAIS